MIGRIEITRMFLLLYFVFFGLLSGIHAQAPGGYSLIPNDDAEALAAAKFAIREEGQKLDKTIVFSSMVYAQRQVASGTNFKMCVKVKVNGTSKRAETVVNRSPQKQYTLTSWRWGECTKPAELKAAPPASPSANPAPSGKSFVAPKSIGSDGLREAVLRLNTLR